MCCQPSSLDNDSKNGVELPVPLTWRSRFQYFQICSARNVSQVPTAPDLNPVINHRTRCAEVPWVNASGTT